MNVIDIQHIEDCFNGSFIKEFRLSEAISEAFIRYMGGSGKLQYFPTFARPFFKLELAGGQSLKGVQGNDTMRALLWKQEDIKYIENLVANFNIG